MGECNLYHSGNRLLQDHFGSRALADRLQQKLARSTFTDEDKTFIESLPFFFLATADAEGRPDCSFKGGIPGFFRVIGPGELAFLDYDGNAMFKSLSNLLVNENVGMLFIAMHGKPQRLRLNGTAFVNRDDPLLDLAVGAQMIVRVLARAIFPNCPRYVPSLEVTNQSIHSPRAGVDPPEPAWKGFDVFSDVVPPRHPTFKG